MTFVNSLRLSRRAPMAYTMRRLQETTHRTVSYGVSITRSTEVIQLSFQDEVSQTKTSSITQNNELSRPATSLTNQDIEIPADITDVDTYRASVRALRPKLYTIAR